MTEKFEYLNFPLDLVGNVQIADFRSIDDLNIVEFLVEMITVSIRATALWKTNLDSNKVSSQGVYCRYHLGALSMYKIEERREIYTDTT